MFLINFLFILNHKNFNSAMFLTFLFFSVIIFVINLVLRKDILIMPNTKLIAKNPNAYHNYEIIEKIECGIVLTRNRNKIY